MRWGRWVAGGWLGAALVALGMPACSSLLGTEGYASAAEEACDLYASCFGDQAFPDCVEHVEGQLAAASSASVNAWLFKFTNGEDDCLESCEAIRQCIDSAPICRGAGAACTLDAECCGTSVAGAVCADGACCKSGGQDCADSGECCEGACESPVPGLVEQKTCGGELCIDPGEPCSDQVPCCTDFCEPETNTCSAVGCLQQGASCDQDEACCTDRCDGGVCACSLEGETCSSAAQCCTGACISGTCQGESCALNGESCEDGCCSGACLEGQCCAPPDEECEQSDECCSGVCADGRCDCAGFGQPCVDAEGCCEVSFPSGLACGSDAEATCACRLPGETCGAVGACCVGECAPNGTCACSAVGDDCDEDADCCSNDCSNGKCECAELGDPCTSSDVCCTTGTTNALTCTFGIAVPLSEPRCCVPPAPCGGPLQPCVSLVNAPLDPTCFEGDAFDCVVEVCKEIPWCCCGDWSAVCAQQYRKCASSLCSGF